jgi:hypothetical protein
MKTKILVGGQSEIDRAFIGLLLVVTYCQHQGTIFRSIWFCPGFELVIIAHNDCFYLAWVDL